MAILHFISVIVVRWRHCLALEKYKLDAQYKLGSLMYISDTVSRAYRNTTEGGQHENCEIRALELVIHENISVTKMKRDEFRERVAEDKDIQDLIEIIRHGWPEKAECSQAASPYYDERSSLVESDRLVYRGEQLVVPRSLGKDMLQRIHSRNGRMRSTSKRSAVLARDEWRCQRLHVKM